MIRIKIGSICILYIEILLRTRDIIESSVAPSNSEKLGSFAYLLPTFYKEQTFTINSYMSKNSGKMKFEYQLKFWNIKQILSNL